MKLAYASLLLTAAAAPSTAFLPPSIQTHHHTTTTLHGKLWKRLNIEEDPPEYGTQWYLINCVAGVEFDLLSMAREVTKDFSPDLVEKLVVPTERHLRSHGDTKKVVDVKVRYPGYLFCKIRLTEDVYEVLQELELARSWMGTVNRKGYKKLPPVPLPLNEEEVLKFKGLEEQQEMFEDMFGGDYSGRSDSGEDLLAQYAGYEPGQMVKILRGNFEGEDGTVRRLKDGQIMVRMFTYGQTFDNWFDPDAIRPLSDLEVMRGLSGPTKPIDQDQFDVSIGKKDPSILRDDVDFENTRDGRSSLMQNAGVGPERNRRQDRIARGETGKDLFGRTPEEIKQEEANWLAYREEKRANQRAGPSAVIDTAAPKKKKKEDGPKKGHDTWGIVERSSWDGGEFGFENFREEEKAARKRLEEMYQDRGEFRSYDRSQRRNSRQGRDDNKQRFVRDDSRGRRSFDDRDRDGMPDQRRPMRDSSANDDFFSSLVKELNDDVDTPQQRERGTCHHDDAGPMRDRRRPVRDSPATRFRDGDKFGRSRRVKEEDWASKSEAVNNNDSDDFFSSLMKELKDDVDSSSGKGRGTTASNTSNDDDDFFANLESQLSSSLSSESQYSSDNNDDNFFDNLQSELDSSLSKSDSQDEKHDNDMSDNDFFASLQQEMDDSLSKAPEELEPVDNFFAGLMDDVADELERTENEGKNGKQSSGGTNVFKASAGNHGDYDSMTVPELKELLKSKGLKVGGRKAELIERLSLDS